MNRTNIKLGKKCVLTRETSFVEVSCEDGSSYAFDLLIAADGIHSHARKDLLPNKIIRHSGQTCYRGISSIPLAGEFRSAYLEYIGNNLRFGLADMGSDKCYWYAVEEVGADNENASTETKKHLTRLFSCFPKFICQHISHSPIVLKNEMYDLKPSSHKWYTDKMCLIGDAAHATTPNLAQGACQALEDAYTLIACLTKMKESKVAFAKYQSLRQVKADYVVNQSWRYGKLMHTKSKIKEKLLLLMLSLTPNKYFAAQLHLINDLSYLDSL
jgi:2-polyprenyl-6-methoxyphenol hydroxylase-like FAD-dependent oxidoreductase